MTAFPTWLRRAAWASVAYLLFTSTGEDADGDGAWTYERSWPAPWAARGGCPGPAVLYPRHRITSGVPPVLLAVVEDSGPVAVVLSRRGQQRAWRTKSRSLPWPEGWAPLRPGERGTVTVESCGRRDQTWFAFTPLAPDLRATHGAQGVPWLLDSGLPMEAMRLLAVDPHPDRPEWVRGAVFRTGLPILGQWSWW